MRSFLLLLSVQLFFSVSSAKAVLPDCESFGRTKDGTEVHLYTLRSDSGLMARVTEYGATLVELHVPDADGNTADVILGFDDVSGYQSDSNQYFGCTTGRVCNRIAKGQFRLNGRTYTLATNDGPNHLHGGSERSLDKVIWTAEPFDADGRRGVVFSYTSPDGEEGYPGNLILRVTYSVSDAAADLTIDYTATTDQPTPVNLTNHAYFNLSGAGSATVLDHLLQIHADHYTPVDETLIPTGAIDPVAGTPLDFRTPHAVGERIGALVETPTLGYDHNFILNRPDDHEDLFSAAVLTDPKSGRRLTVKTTLPAIQFYSGNFLKGQTGKAGRVYPLRSALCLETQYSPDSVNHPNFPSIILEPGETFSSRTVYSFDTAP